MITILLSITCIFAGIYIIARTLREYQKNSQPQPKEDRRAVLWEAYAPLIQDAIFKGDTKLWKEIWREYDRNVKHDGNEKELPPNGQFAATDVSAANASTRDENEVSHRLTA